MKICVGDLESNGLLPTATKVHCGVFKDIQTGEVVKFRPHQIAEMLSFLDTVDVLCMHNGIGFDWPLLKKLYGYDYKGKKVDTLIMSRLLNPQRQVPFNCINKKAGPHSVEAWGYRVGRGKPEHNDWENFSEEMLHRCSEDVEIQHLIYEALLKEAKGKNWRDAFLLSFKLFEYLQKQEEYGWLVDRPYMEKCIHQLEHWIARIDRALEKHLPVILEIQENKQEGEYAYIRKPFLKSGEYSRSVTAWYDRNGFGDLPRIVGGPFSRIFFRKVDLDSNQETKDFLLRSGWEPLEWNTNDEGEKTSPKLSKDDPFDGINGGVGRLVARRVQCRQRKGIIEGLVKAIREDGRIPSVINSLAATGRATHRNIVNIPRPGSFYGKQLRKMFTCKDGFVLVGADADGCQIRNLAGRMCDEGYTETVVNGKKEDKSDIHSVNMRAAELDNRDMAKTFFYALIFGAGDAKIEKVTGKNGRQLKDKFFKNLPAMGELVKNLTVEWRSTAKKRFNPKWNKFEFYDGYITGLDGRPVYVPSEHQCLVYQLQSDEAILMAAAYCKTVSDLEKKYQWGKDFGVVIWMHDEIQIECRKEIAEDIGRTMANSIEWAGKQFKMGCPQKGDYSIGKTWADTH